MLRPGDATAAAVFTVAFAISLLETPGDGNRSARHSGVPSECRRVSARPAGASLHGAANGGTGDAAAEAGPAARELQQARAGAGWRRCSSERVPSWRGVDQQLLHRRGARGSAQPRGERSGACVRGWAGRRSKTKLTSRAHLAVREAAGPSCRRGEERRRSGAARTFRMSLLT